MLIFPGLKKIGYLQRGLTAIPKQCCTDVLPVSKQAACKVAHIVLMLPRCLEFLSRSDACSVALFTESSGIAFLYFSLQIKVLFLKYKKVLQKEKNSLCISEILHFFSSLSCGVVQGYDSQARRKEKKAPITSPTQT